jgi:hypothetical protein
MRLFIIALLLAFLGGCGTFSPGKFVYTNVEIVIYQGADAGDIAIHPSLGTESGDLASSPVADQNPNFTLTPMP